jgi:hypothetical protein
LQTQNRKILFIKKLFLLFLIIFSFISATVIDPIESIEISENSFPKNNSLEFPYLQKNFVGFKEAVAFKESQGKYNVINTLGYLGKYQFGRTTLERFRIYDTQKFLKNPELQEKAFAAYCSVNKWILRKDIRRSVGKTINGIKITESGILAAAHLSGAGNVKKYLRSNGQIHFSDAYGSTVQSYLKKFAGYNVSNIKAERMAKV